jgi:hypothetical protein
VQVARLGSSEAVSSNEGSIVSVLDSVHSQTVDLLAQTRVLGSRKASILRASQELAASTETLRDRLKDLVMRVKEEVCD